MDKITARCSQCKWQTTRISNAAIAASQCAKCGAHLLASTRRPLMIRRLPPELRALDRLSQQLRFVVKVRNTTVAAFVLERDARGFAKARYGDMAHVRARFELSESA